MRIEYPFLFNFAASYSGGGYKRLHEYARWFDGHGGTSFAIHRNCEHLRTLFPGNRYFTVAVTHFQRLYDDSSYLDEIGRITGRPELYYAYGIPLYRRFGQINWFHLQNALTMGTHQAPLSVFHRLKFRLLGSRFRRGFALADVISAESRYSLGLIDVPGSAGKFLSTNGNDDELARLAAGGRIPPEPFATAVGTFSYKAVGESFQIFQALRDRHQGLKLLVIGDAAPVPGWLKNHPDVIMRGTLDRQEVIDILRRSKFYISATYCENSYNGAAEGAFLADESFVSDIPPHHELLQSERHELTRIAGLSRPFFHVHREQLTGVSLKSWHSIITEMISRIGYEHSAAAPVVPLHRTAANELVARDVLPRQRLPG
jgi:glycosyltransferase involved in cell wall biosynthesis